MKPRGSSFEYRVPDMDWHYTKRVVESLPELRQFLGFLPWVASESTPESSEARCLAGAANFLSRTDLPFLAFEKSSGQLLGGVGLHRTV